MKWVFCWPFGHDPIPAGIEMGWGAKMLVCNRCGRLTIEKLGILIEGDIMRAGLEAHFKAGWHCGQPIERE